jgi:hypothetical protein
MVMKRDILCSCGCGQQTNTTKDGRPYRYRRGHNRRGRPGNGWIECGHRFISVNGTKIAEHRHIVEEREGRKLRSDEIVHHVDGDPLNNDPDNLVVLSRSEHIGLHARARKRRWTPAEKQRSLDLYEAGMTIDEVAYALKRPYSSTRLVIATAGRSRRPRESRAIRGT